MSEANKQSFRIYFAGASLAFGLPFLIIEIIATVVNVDLFKAYKTMFGVIYVSLYLVGGFVGGALVARKTGEKNKLRVGVTTGLMAFLLQQTMSFIFYGTDLMGDPYTLFAVSGGAIVGALYSKPKNKEKKPVEAKTSAS